MLGTCTLGDNVIRLTNNPKPNLYLIAQRSSADKAPRRGATPNVHPLLPCYNATLCSKYLPSEISIELTKKTQPLPHKWNPIKSLDERWMLDDDGVEGGGRGLWWSRQELDRGGWWKLWMLLEEGFEFFRHVPTCWRSGFRNGIVYDTYGFPQVITNGTFQLSTSQISNNLSKHDLSGCLMEKREIGSNLSGIALVERKKYIIVECLASVYASSIV